MKFSHLLLCCSAIIPFTPGITRAGERSNTDWAVERVKSGLLEPMQKRHARFSRSRPIPREQRVRVETPAKDERGRQFMSWAVDVRFGDEWRESQTVGCVYRATGDIFVLVGEEYYPAKYLLGEEAKPVTGVCSRGASS